MKTVKLREIAHSRAGDKGNISNIAVIAYNMDDYYLLVEQVTPEAVKEVYKGIVNGEVVRYELPAIGALNFMLYDSLGGGVSRTLRLDNYGKALSSAILSYDMQVDDNWQRK
jgi:hypothetical protein